MKRVDEVVLSGERALVVRSNRAGLCGERRPQKRRRLCVLSEPRKRTSQVRGGAQRLAVLEPFLPCVDAQEVSPQSRSLCVLPGAPESRGVRVRRQEAVVVNLRLVRVLRPQRNCEP